MLYKRCEATGLDDDGDDEDDEEDDDDAESSRFIILFESDNDFGAALQEGWFSPTSCRCSAATLFLI